MKSHRLLFMLLLVLSAQPLWAQHDTLKVLFLGNSYTYFNDLPNMFVDLSRSGERPVLVDSNTPGGYTLLQHSTNAISLEKISQGMWDYVILQEQSQIPTIDYWRYNSMYPAARLLDSLITEHNDNTAFFMTWGRKYGGTQTIGGYSSPPFVDFFHMQDSLSSAYTQIAGELSAILCPVGNAWATAVRMDSTVDLWQGDNSHPTLRGSYLAACVFYVVFFDESPVGLEYTAGLHSEDALFLQQAAEQTVMDIVSNSIPQPSSFILYQNFPNPFNSGTTIHYNLQTPTEVELKIVDILGREVITIVDRYQTAGPKSLIWNGIDESGFDVSSGIYFYIIQAGRNTESKKLIILR